MIEMGATNVKMSDVLNNDNSRINPNKVVWCTDERGHFTLINGTYIAIRKTFSAFLGNRYEVWLGTSSRNASFIGTVCDLLEHAQSCGIAHAVKEG